MKGLIEHMALLNSIELYNKNAEVIYIKVPQTDEMVCINFGFPDKTHPEFNYNVEFQVTKEFYKNNLIKILENKHE